MAVDSNPPSRRQLAKVAGDDPELVRALERLFQQALSLTPTELDAVVADINANTAAISANDVDITALDARIDDLEINDLADVDAGSPTAGMVLIYDASAGAWEAATVTAGSNITVTNADGSITIATTGATGSFTAQSGETVTVSNGIITSIV